MIISSYDQSISESDLESIFEFSTLQFQAFHHLQQNISTNNPSNISDWKRLLHQNKGKIYICSTKEVKYAGFLFTYHKSADSIHIWLALTNQNIRKQGVMTRLFQFLEKDVIARNITVNTIPSQFKDMPAFLIKQGFENTSSPNEVKHKYVKQIKMSE
jgi:N-acetylglutamate synthase-like GNAT family acetyltransferase